MGDFDDLAKECPRCRKPTYFRWCVCHLLIWTEKFHCWRKWGLHQVHGETVWNICHPGDNVQVRVLVSEKRGRKEDTGGRDDFS